MSDLEAFAEDGSVFEDANPNVDQVESQQQVDQVEAAHDSDLDSQADMEAEMPPLVDDFPELAAAAAQIEAEVEADAEPEIEAEAEPEQQEEAVVEQAAAAQEEAEVEAGVVADAVAEEQEEEPVVAQEEQPAQVEEDVPAQVEEAVAEEEPVAEVEEAAAAAPAEKEEPVVEQEQPKQEQVQEVAGEAVIAGSDDGDVDGLVESGGEEEDAAAAFEDVDPEDMDDGITPIELVADPIPEEPIAWTELDKKYRRARMFQSLQSNGIGEIFFGDLEADAPQPEKADTAVSTATATADAQDATDADADADPQAEADAEADSDAPPKLEKDDTPAAENAETEAAPAKIPMLKAFVNRAVELLTEGAEQGHFMSQLRLWQHQFRQIGGKLSEMDLSHLEECCNHDLESYRATSKLPFRPNYFQTVHMALARAYSIHSQKKDFYLAANHFRQSARLGDPMAIQRLGYVEYRISQELLATDFQAGLRYLKLAAKHKFADAHHHLMNIYVKGHPPLIEKNPERALRYAVSGSALGSGACLYLLGESHEKAGRQQEAAQCLLQAAQSGVHAAVRYLQYMAMNGSAHGARALMEFQQWSQQQQMAMEQQLRLQRLQAMVERQQKAGPAVADKKSTPCARCERPNSTHRCGKCKKAKYCSEDCQQRHWKAHKAQCKKWTEGRA